MAKASPAGMATVVTGRRWYPHRHLLHLNNHLIDIDLGRVKNLLVMMPPQHGKSQLNSCYMPSWYLMKNPDKRVILASYEADFASQWGRRARDVVEEWGDELFGVRVSDTSNAADRWDIEGWLGGMNTAGVRGPITGKGADLLIIDDPVKNDEEARSETYRERTWEWYRSTALTRVREGGATVIVMTRWHEDDIIGRLMKNEPGLWEVVRLPAVAEELETWPAVGTRAVGEPLCSKLFTLETLEAKKASLGSYWWAGLYQQRPYPLGGGLFKRLWFQTVNALPAIEFEVRAWDLAASTTGKRTAGVKVAKGFDGFFYVTSVVKGQWTPGARDQVIAQTASGDGRHPWVVIEEEPGSGGIAQVDSLIRLLTGWRVEGVKATGDKVTRAAPAASQCEIGRVRLLAGTWNAEFLDELESFPEGTYSDQVDAFGMAFTKIAAMRGASTPPAVIGDETDDELPTGMVGRMIPTNPFYDVTPRDPRR